MSAYQKLVGYVVDHRPGGVAIDAFSADLTINGVIWNVPCLMIEVAQNIVISPESDALDGNIVFRLDRWQIIRRTPMVRLPLVSTNQAAAVKAANAFRADPNISFDDSKERLISWVEAYIAQPAPAVNQ